MKSYSSLFIVLSVLTTCLGGIAQTTLPNELVQARVTVNGTRIFSNRIFPKSLAKGLVFAGRDTIISLAERGVTVPECAKLCQVYLQTDVRKQARNTNELWFQTVLSRGESVLTNRSVLIWVGPKDFMQAYREVSTRGGGSKPPPLKLGGDSSISTSPSTREKCECESEICIAQDGTASFSFECNGVGFVVSTKGEFSLTFGGNRASAEVVVIGSKSN